MNVTHQVYIPGMRNFQGFNWVVTAKVARLTGFEKYQSHIVVGCLMCLLRDHTPKGGDLVLVHRGVHV